MIVEERCYTMVPGGVPKWIELYERGGLEVQSRILGNRIGCFQTETGTLNQIVHIWGFEDFNDRMSRREKLFKDPQWLSFAEKAAELIVNTATFSLISVRMRSSLDMGPLSFPQRKRALGNQVARPGKLASNPRPTSCRSTKGATPL